MFSGRRVKTRVPASGKMVNHYVMKALVKRNYAAAE
jgi:hypothetical protein